jgi:outer membrane protein OmpU
VINGTPLAVTAGTPNAVNVPTTGLAGAVATAQTNLDNAIAATGAPAASGTGSLAALKTATDALAAAEKVLAAVSGTPAVDAVASDTLITSRLRLNIAASTESDSGVTFGMSVRVQQDEGNTNSFNAARFYAKSGGLELGVGNIYGVIDNMAGLYSGSVGLTGLGWGNVVSNFGSLAYSSGGAGSAGTKEAAEVIYSMGDYGFAVATDGTDTEYGVSATMSGWTVALSASDTDTAANSEWVATVGGSIGGVKVGLATAEAVNGDSSTTLSAAFDVAAATSVTVYYNDDEANTIDDKSYGLGVVHGLGGGASLRGGIVSVNDRTVADFGVLFNF